MAETKIEWADVVWNPITGCTPISEGCQNCYARRIAYRLKGRFGYPENDPFRVTFHGERLEEPLKWKKSRRIFVCSMGDLFHENIPFEWINDIFGIIMMVPQHVFMLLTKRPERALEYHQYSEYEFTDGSGKLETSNWEWPVNIWLGVTAENQKRADERIPVLLQIPASERFVSIEPMLGPIDLLNYLGLPICNTCSCRNPL